MQDWYRVADVEHITDLLTTVQRARPAGARLRRVGEQTLCWALALAALLTAAVVAFTAQRSVEAQTPNANTMQTGGDTDRDNFRLELGLVDDSDNIVPAGSTLRVKAVVKFDVPNDKTNGIGEGDHGRFGAEFNVQAGGTLRIVGQFEWENAGGRTLRIDPDRIGKVTDDDPGERGTAGIQHANCGAEDDFDKTNGLIVWSTADMNQIGAADCVSEPMAANGRILPPRDDDWKYLAYSWQGLLGNGYDVFAERDGVQGPCKPSTTDDVTTWTCELNLVDEQFGWRGNNTYASLNGQLIAASNPNWSNWALIPQRNRNDNDAAITIPESTPDGAFTISGSVVLHSATGRVPAQAARNEDKMVLTDTLTVQVGTVTEAASAEFGFATQTATDAAAAPQNRPGEPWPSQVRANGGETKLQLRVLNENGQPSARNSLNSILMRTNLGTLASNIDDGETGDGDGCVGNGGLACQVPVRNLDTTNSGNIVFTLSAPSKNQAGAAQVTGSVVNSRGEVLPIDTLSVIFTGAASTIALSDPTSSILNEATSEANDNRDQLTLSVLATDAAGRPAEVPTRNRATTVKGPDDAEVAQSASTIQVAWPYQSGDPAADVRDAQGNLQARITVGAEAASLLQTGEYTLEVRAGGLKAQQTFIVAGEAANVKVESSESDYRLNDQFTLTATVTNADGSTVPDGTPVSFTTAEDVTGSTRLVQLRGPQGTKSGQASAAYVVVAEGRAWVTVSSGAGTDVWNANVGAAAPPPRAAPELSGRAGLVVYLGDAAVQASALLQALDNVTTIRLYRAGAWVLYGVVDGRELPGSEDFTVTPGNVLWIGS